MIDHELDGLQRVHTAWISAEAHDAVAHRGKIDDRRHAGEVLEEDARGHEGDLLLRLGRQVPAGQRLDVVAVDEPAVLTAQQVLEQDLERVRQTGRPPKPAFSSAGRLKM